MEMTKAVLLRTEGGSQIFVEKSCKEKRWGCIGALVHGNRLTGGHVGCYAMAATIGLVPRSSFDLCCFHVNYIHMRIIVSSCIDFPILIKLCILFLVSGL
ncbi:hypothetical protein ABZP36_021372 [Zizania latifolia]